MIRFQIKNTASKAEKEGDTFIRFSGVSEPFFRSSERASTQIGVDAKGNAKVSFLTGLDEEKVQLYSWYNEDEKKEVVKQIKNLLPSITVGYGGAEVIDPNNEYFWSKNREVSRLSLTNEDLEVFYDTKNKNHALLYLSIIGGAFIDLVAPTRDWAEKYQIPHYLALETDDTFEEEDEITRSDAHAALSELRKSDPEGLFILAWCIQYDTNSFGAYLRSTPQKDLATYHIKFIDGKLQTKKKKNCPKTFMEYYNKWNAQQTKPTIYTEAYLKAGEYYSFISQKSKRFETSAGTILGNTVEEAVKTLMKPKFSQDYESLRDLVEAKWKE